MTRFTSRAVTDLAIWVLLLELATGAVFPFFAILRRVDPAEDPQRRCLADL